MTELSMDDADRVELVWPGKSLNVRVSQTSDGKWSTGQLTHKGELRGFSVSERIGTNSSDDVSLVITGDRHDAMRALRRAVGPAFKLIYLDLPRLNVDDAETAFQSSSTKRLTTWLAVVRAFLLEARALLARQGVVAVHCGEQEAHYARMILDELFRDKRVGTIIWQKTYSARNMPGMKEFTDAHDLIYLYARDKDALGPVALKRAPKGYGNADSDPRGAWKAEHKGAKTRRGNSDFNTFQPPYRWRLISGALPDGLWRVSPFTGVIWGKPTIPGVYVFTIEVTDQNGAAARKKLSIEVTTSGAPIAAPDIPWIFEELSTKGALAVATTELPNGVVGQEYSAVLFARERHPLQGRADPAGVRTLLGFCQEHADCGLQGGCRSLGQSTTHRNPDS
ncbi:DNA methyltransferase [Sphingomonas sp. H160509]|uniref:DNA methyltransferase n=1 Tax=Sphingomonas sp. H160509 TaxID=2955313 RepID=UPI00209833CB|nr:DNA methyltransferase [Sphingomonas sp. H160509]MDD1449788.1 DNA methyltransferase [Sphingomonas sp. H160509]